MLLIIPLIFGVLGAIIASGKNRNALGWGLLCFLLPLIGLLILIFQKSLPSRDQQLAKAIAAANSTNGTAKVITDASGDPKWKSLVALDADIAAAAEAARRLGSKYEALLAEVYLPLSDKQYLPAALEKVRSQAAADRNTA